MTWTHEDKLAIKAELTNDPLTLGLTTLPENDEANANLLNEVRVTIQVDRESIPVSDVVKAIDADEFIAMSAPQRDYVKLITNGGTVNPKSGSEVREALLQFFNAGTETRANLTALLTEAGSRITQLYKAGIISVGHDASPSDIANARQET